MQQLSFLPGEMTPGERSLIQRALKTLDRHLHEPGVAFTSTHAAREWLILNMAGLEREEFRVLYLNNQKRGFCPMITYEPFWNTLRNSGESTYTLIRFHKFSSATIERLRKNRPLNTTTLNDLCRILNCSISDILEYRPSSRDQIL